MRSVVLRSLAVIAAGALVLIGVLYVASTVDARPPQVLSVTLTQPAGDDPEVALITTTLEVVFSEPVDARSAERSVSIEPAVDGAVSWSGSTMIVTPREPLALDTAYRVEIGSGIEDLSGNEMAELPPPFEFRTAGPPSLVEAVPADGATDVAVDEPLSLTFSRLMDTASVEAALRLRPAFAHELRWSGEVLEIVPTEPLRPGADYVVSIRAGAADVAGVALGAPITVAFRTVAPGLAAETLIPADGIDGVAPTSPIAVVFDRPIDPASIDPDLLTITPEVAGTLTVEALADEAPNDDGAGRVLRFAPSGPLPANTTFDVELATGATSTTGGGLGAPLAWSFTTGAPLTAVSNQIAFLSDRGGVANVWAMNRDGTGKRQLTAELEPVIDFAVAPDGSSLVIGDGRRLVYQRADGSDRRLLTDDGELDFDASYAPDGTRLAFARADAATGEGLGIWTWEVGGGDPTAVVLPTEVGAEASAGADATRAQALRAPRWSADGSALAFVDLSGAIGMLELPAERLTTVPFMASDAPIWLPGSGGILVVGTEAGFDGEPRFDAPIEPLHPGPRDETFRLSRSGTHVAPTSFGRGARVLAVSADGEIAWVGPDGALHVADSPSSAPGQPVLDDVRVAAAAFAPGERAMVIVDSAGDAETGRLEYLDLDSGQRTELAAEGSRPRWQP